MIYKMYGVKGDLLIDPMPSQRYQTDKNAFFRISAWKMFWVYQIIQTEACSFHVGFDFHHDFYIEFVNSLNHSGARFYRKQSFGT